MLDVDSKKVYAPHLYLVAAAAAAVARLAIRLVSVSVARWGRYESLKPIQVWTVLLLAPIVAACARVSSVLKEADEKREHETQYTSNLFLHGSL